VATIGMVTVHIACRKVEEDGEEHGRAMVDRRHSLGFLAVFACV
jgi:hypothetical protein